MSARRRPRSRMSIAMALMVLYIDTTPPRSSATQLDQIIFLTSSLAVNAVDPEGDPERLWH